MKDDLKPIAVGKTKKPTILEKTRQKNIVKYLNAVPNCISEIRTQTGFGKKGGADVLGCIDGRHFELEVKQPRQQLSKLQADWLKDWSKRGAITGRVEDVATTRQLFRDHGIEI